MSNSTSPTPMSHSSQLPQPRPATQPNAWCLRLKKTVSVGFAPLTEWPLVGLKRTVVGSARTSPLGRACVKTPARFDTDLFCSLFRALRPLGSEKIAKNFALRDCLQKFAGFSHGLGQESTLSRH